MTELKINDLVFAKVKPNAIIPTKENENAGYDIYACFEDEYMIIPPHSTRLIPTGIASAVSDKYYLQVHERGSTGSKGMKYGAGVVDSSYRGEIFVCINNINSTEIIISKISREELIEKYAIDEFGDGCKVLNYGGEFDNAYFDDPNFPCNEPIIYPYSKAIAQLIVHEVPVMNIKEITYEELQAIPSERGTGALGSSGK
jgi:dUTP pyrophosphatase